MIAKGDEEIVEIDVDKRLLQCNSLLSKVYPEGTRVYKIMISKLAIILLLYSFRFTIFNTEGFYC